MDLMIPDEENRFEIELIDKTEVLETLEPLVEKLIKQHLSKRNLWYSSDFLPADELESDESVRALAQLRDRSRGLPDAVRVAVALNLLTEEGLPHFHRILSNYLGNGNAWSKWNFMWTGEEDRHGAALRDYARDARLFRFREIEMLQYAYNAEGFTPDWDKDPYRVFVYTTLQERATQFSHRNTGRLAGQYEPTLERMLEKVASDEAKHFNFYRRIFKAILEVDPNRALESLLAVVPKLQMPGVSMPHFKEMADVVRYSGIYGPRDYREIVERALEFWKIGVLTGLSEKGRKAQEQIMRIPERLQKFAELIERRSSSKSFSFGFLYDRVLSLD